MSSLLLLLSSRRFLASVVNKTLPKRLLNADAAPMEKLRSRLLWQSKKRGILENDILIGGFAEENLAKMSAKELASYDEMINGRHMEWDLYYYFTGRREAPEDLCDNPTFQQIRKYVLARKHGGEQR